MGQTDGDRNEREEPVKRSRPSRLGQIICGGLLIGGFTGGCVSTLKMGFAERYYLSLHPPEKVQEFYNDFSLMNACSFSGNEVLDPNTYDKCIQVKNRYDEELRDGTLQAERASYEREASKAEHDIDVWKNLLFASAIGGAVGLACLGASATAPQTNIKKPGEQNA